MGGAEQEADCRWEAHGSTAFRCLDEMRSRGEQVDLTVRGEDGAAVPCHRIVLSAVSPYFRAMFRSWSPDAGEEVTVHGVEGAALQALVASCYTGELRVSLESVAELLAGADLLLLDWAREQCGAFLLDRLHLDNCVAAARLASLYRLPGLDSAAQRFLETEFRGLVAGGEWLQLEKAELLRLLHSDGLVAEEDELVEAVVAWLAEVREPGAGGEELLLEGLRFPLCSPAFRERVEREERLAVVRGSTAWREHCAAARGPGDLSAGRRCRGTNDMLVVHHDASHVLYGFNTAGGTWQEVSMMPPGGGYEYAALAAAGTRLFLVGGRSREGQSLRSVFCLDLLSMAWTRLPDMKEVRWYHGAAVIGSRLYAVAGCGQLDSVEWLELEAKGTPAASSLELEGGGPPAASSQWRDAQKMAVARHMPGVGALGDRIYVCGGTDDTWTAFSAVEALDTATGLWHRLPDMLVPRVQPAVVACGDRLYVLGGRNSNKVELMSAERYDPATGQWEMVKEMHKKRWGPGAAVLHKRIVAVGGRGKRVGRSAEVYCEEGNCWTLLPGETPTQERVFQACLVHKPWNWSFK